MLRIAIDLFNRHGYDGTSMGDLAAELGVTKSAIYHHVPSKEHLLSQALDEALEGLESAITVAEGMAGASAYERLRSVVRQSVEVLVAHQPAVTLLLRVRGNSDIELKALARRRHIDARLTALVQAAVAEGSLRTDLPPDLVSRLLFGMVNSLVEWHIPGRGIDAHDLAEAIATLAFDGLHR
ncbi:TetR/AcrR family transcriptional regulator [Nocardioides dilutus]